MPAGDPPSTPQVSERILTALPLGEQTRKSILFRVNLSVNGLVIESVVFCRNDRTSAFCFYVWGVVV
jgi:hypothetical protein